MDPGEVVEADSGYNGEMALKTPTVAKSRQAKKQKSIIRARQENTNARLKQFKALRHVFVQSHEKHKMVFYMVAVVTQLGLEHNTLHLYAVEDDEIDYF